MALIDVALTFDVADEGEYEDVLNLVRGVGALTVDVDEETVPAPWRRAA